MIVQAAIDIIEINKAIDVAGQALEAGVDWIEVGYPLIKFQGLNNTLVARNI
jgi:3-hexulose-6-phosphate synthase/6-phospho-3-hexuloisomerase